MNSSISSEDLGKISASIAVFLTVLAITAILLIYYQTTWSMIATWHRSETYAHGFLILPFVVYMIWVKRRSIGMVKQQPNPTALIGLCVLGFLWLVAELASVQVVTQYALVAMLPLIVAVILGYKVMFAMASDSIEIKIVEREGIKQPNIFSPNGDNNNDKFTLYFGPEVVRIVFLQIYTRWGERVFNGQNLPPNDPELGWDGAFRGKPLNPAVFAWVAKVEKLDGSTEIFYGDVLLVR